MKRVFIDAEKLKNLNSGLGQYCLHLGKSLTRNSHASLDFCFYVPAHCQGLFGNQVIYRSHNQWDKLFKINQESDVWHCTHQESAFLPVDRKTRIITTIHDLNFLHTGKGSLKIKYRLSKIQKLINRSTAITTISHYTAMEIRNFLQIPDIPLKVIYNGNSLHEGLNEKRPGFIKEGKFFFSVGIISPKKNFHTLIPLLKYLKDYYLIIAGIKSHRYAKQLMELAAAEGVQSQVLLPGPVTEEEKLWLYKNCTAFLFPSIAEGFGLPVVEAMGLGKPVFISTHTSLPEIGGEAAFYFRNFDPGEMCRTIEEGLKEYNSNGIRQMKLTEQAALFSWDKAAAEYTQLYLNL